MQEPAAGPEPDAALAVLRGAGIRAEAQRRFGEPALRMNVPGGVLVISLFGAQVLEWRPGGTGNLLWLTDETLHKPGAPIRGGIPLCWPWFGAAPAPFHGPSHGPGRRGYWQLTQARAGDDGILLSFRFALDEPGLQADLCVRAGSQLDLELTTTHHGARALPVTPAFHPYFRVRSPQATALRFQQPVAPRDRLASKLLAATRAIAFGTGETELEWQPWQDMELAGGNTALRLSSDTATHCVAWNPGPEKASRLDDLAPGAFREFVCVEPAQLATAELLQPGARRSLSLRIAGA